MAVTYRDVRQTAWSSGTASPVVNKPTGVQDGDVMLMFVVTNTAANTAAGPIAGWAKVGAEVDAGSTVDTTTSLWWKLHSGDGSSWTMTDLFDATETGMATVIAYYGVDQTTPVNTNAQAGLSTAGTTVSGPSITPTVDNCMIVQFAGTDPGTGAYAGTADTSPTGTERFDAKEETGGSLAYTFIQEYQQGSKAAIALDATLTSDIYGYHQVAIAPGPFIKNLTEAATLTDTLTAQGSGVTATETATLGHSTLKLLGIILLEAMSLTDPAVTSKLTSRTLVETASLTDPVVTTEKTGGAGSYDKTLTEGLSLTDTRTRDVGRTISESATLLDTVSKGAGRSLTESAGLSDSLTAGASRTKELTESVGLTDTVTRKGMFTLLPNLSINLSGDPPTAEIYAADFINDPGNYGSFVVSASADGPWGASVRFIKETGYMLTVYVKGTPLTGVGDDAIHAGVIDVLDLSGLVEPYSQTVSLTGSVLKSSVKAPQEAVGLTDTLTRQVTSSRDLPETVGLTDNVSTQYTSGPQNYAKELTESTPLTGLVTKGIGRSLSDTVLARQGTDWESNPSYYSVSGNSFTRTAVNGNNGTIYSVGQLNGDCWVEFKASATDKQVGIGLSNDAPTNTNAYYDVDFFLHCGNDAVARVYENGVYKTNLGAYTTSTVFKIKYSWRGQQIQFFKDGALTSISAGSPTAPFYVCGWAFNQNAGCNSIYWGSDERMELVTSRTVADAAGLVDSQEGKQTGRTLTESLTLTDPAVTTGARTKELTESLSLSDTATKTLAAQHTSTEAATLADTVKKDTVKLRTEGGVSSSPKLVDVVTTLKGLGREYSESATLTGTLTKGPGKSATEAVGLTDSLVKVFSAQKTLTETAGLTDTASKGEGRQLTDGVGLTGSLSKAESRSLLETAGLTGTLSLTQTQKQLSEQLNLSDVKETQHGGNSTKELSDPAQLTDTFSRQVNYQRVLVEAAGLAGSVTKGPGPVRTESVGLTDTILYSAGWAYPDTLTLTAGAIVSGSLVNVWGDDGTELVLSELQAPTNPAFVYDWDFGRDQPVPTTHLTLTVKGWYDGSSGHQVHLYQYNYNTTSWVRVTSDTFDFPGAASEGTYQFTLIDNANYISNGRIRIRISHDAVGLNTHQFHVDEMFLSWLSPSLTETATLSDSIRKDEGRNLTETETLSDVVAKGLGRLRTEAVGLTDSPQKSTSRVLTEGVALTDSVTEAATYLKQLTEGSTLTGTLTRGVGKQRAEAAALTDTVQKSTGILLGEGVGLSETIAFGPTRVNYEGLGLTETLTKALGRTLAEGLTVADQTVTTQHIPYGGNSYNKELTEAVGLAGTLTKGAGRQLSEVTALLDSLTRQAGFARTLTEGAALVDSLLKRAGKLRSETLSLTESLTIGKAKILTESVGLSDQLTRVLGASRTLLETASLSDVLDTTAETKVLTEAAGISDAIHKGLSRELVETASLSESFNTPKNLLEGVVLTDTFEFGFNRTKNFVQYIPLIDTLELTYGLAGAAPTEELTLEDTRSASTSRVLTETLGVNSTVAAPDGYGVEQWFTFAG